MQDTPGGSFNVYDAWYMDLEYKTYILFMPPHHPELVVIPQFVPLKKVDWAFKISAFAPNPPMKYTRANCGRGIQKGCPRAPRRCRFIKTPFPPHPEWDGFIEDDNFTLYRPGANPTNPNASPPAEGGWRCGCNSTPSP